MLKVNDGDLGVWIAPKSSVAFMVEAVELARKNGFDVADDWRKDKLKFFTGEADEEMMLALLVMADFSIQYLNEEISEEYEFQIDTENETLGLSLVRT